MSNSFGIYLIKNNVTNKLYVGSTIRSFSIRFSQHKYNLKRNLHKNIHLQRSWNKYGENSFSFIILELCKKEDCLKKEQYYIDSLVPEFNIKKIAGRTVGFKHSEKTKKKCSEANKGKNHPNFGKHLSEKTKEKIGASNSRKVICLNDKKIFRSITAAGDFYNVHSGNITRCIKKGYKVRGLSFKYVK